MADLAIGIGTRYSDFTTASMTAFQDPQVRFVNINVAEFDAYKLAAVPLVADARVALEELREALDGHHVSAEYAAQVAGLKQAWETEVDRLFHLGNPARPAQSEVIGAIWEASGPRDVLLSAAGSHPGDLHTAVVMLRFRNGVIGTIDNCRKTAYGYDQRVEVLGSDGAIATGNCYSNQAAISTATAVRRDLPLHFFMERYAESFTNELRAFVRAVLDDSPTLATGVDGRTSIAMGLAARKSYDEHRPVRLEEVDPKCVPLADVRLQSFPCIEF
ncbi:MAG: Gfo/Idh/MocA family oxidoreductase [Acidobacteriaceae bacterium]